MKHLLLKATSINKKTYSKIISQNCLFTIKIKFVDITIFGRYTIKIDRHKIKFDRYMTKIGRHKTKFDR